MDSDGSNQRFLEDNPWVMNLEADWSPDGSKIVFLGNSENIYVMDADGSNVTQLTDNFSYNEEPSWSPDGSKIAFVSSENIYVMDADGSNQKRLTDNLKRNNYPSWRPAR